MPLPLQFDDAIYRVSLFSAFSNELQKEAGEFAKSLENFHKGFPYRDAAMVGLGAAGLYGAKRLYKDIKVGEEQRRAMREAQAARGGPFG